MVNSAAILNLNTALKPSKSFVDAVSRSPANPIPIKLVSLVQGEPAVIFSTREIQFMAEHFRLSLVGKFSFGRPPMGIVRIFFLFSWI